VSGAEKQSANDAPINENVLSSEVLNVYGISGRMPRNGPVERLDVVSLLRLCHAGPTVYLSVRSA
jgi:hypothetical protein